MKLKLISILLLSLLLASCLSNRNKSSGDDSVGLQLGFTDSIKKLFKGGFNKPMKSCRMAESIAGFNHTKKKDNDVCTEEQMQVVRAYFGTFEGNFSGDSSGTVKIVISDGGLISGYIISANKKFKLSGRASFVSHPIENHLQIYATASGKAFTFNGKMKEDGLLNTNWSKELTNKSSPLGSLRLHKTAPYKKTERVTTLKKPKKRVILKPDNKLRTDNTELLEAAKNGKTSRIRKLVNSGYDLNAVDKNGLTAFCIALKHGHHQTAQELMVFGSDKNHKDNSGKTPLHYAAIYNAEIIAGVLVRSGVDASEKDNSGKTARDWAIENKNNGVIRMMDAL